MPYPMWENSEVRYREEAKGLDGDKFGGEVLFYRYLAPHMPFAVPKMYFGDVNRESTEACCITMAIPFFSGDKSRPLSDFGFGEIMPQFAKCEDYKLSNPLDFYFPLFANMGIFAGIAKATDLNGRCGLTDAWFDMTADRDSSCNYVGQYAAELASGLATQIVPHWFEEEFK